MDGVRRPKYFNERERRISPEEEMRLIEALAQLDFERAAEQRLQELAGQALEGMTFSSNSARKKVLAQERKRLLPLAEQTCKPVPIFETFAQFQLMTAARRSETLTLTWDRVDLLLGRPICQRRKMGGRASFRCAQRFSNHLVSFQGPATVSFQSGWTHYQMRGREHVPLLV